tara:strand:- start:1109 stop:1423 length:315 start_codon:yes stop_codon:yes gene_type:complete
MINRFVKITVILFSFSFLTGFIPIFSLLGPGMTIMSSGNIYKAGVQYFIDQSVKKETGKNTLTFIGDEIKSKKQETDLNKKLRLLVEKRILDTRAKLNFNNINQ